MVLVSAKILSHVSIGGVSSGNMWWVVKFIRWDGEGCCILRLSILFDGVEKKCIIRKVLLAGKWLIWYK